MRSVVMHEHSASLERYSSSCVSSVQTVPAPKSNDLASRDPSEPLV